MKYISLLVLSVMCLSACGQGPQGPAGATTIIDTDSTTTTNADIIDVLQNGAHGNDYRLGLGQTELSSGLSCQVQKVSAGQCLSAAAAGSAACVGQPTVTLVGTNYAYTYDGAFNQPNAAGSGTFNLIPTPLQTTFENANFRIVCTGFMTVTTPGWYEYEDISDDGSIVFLDGATLYNDGNHAGNAVPVVQSVYLTRDVHTFQVLYAQTGAGNFGLILTQNNLAIDPATLYH